MGLVGVKAMIGPSSEELQEVDFLADTGSFCTAIDTATRDRLKLPRGVPIRTQLADGSVVAAELTSAYLRLNGREGGIAIEIADVPVSLLGISALEALGMKVNPVTRELEVVWPFEAPPTFRQRP